MGGETVICLQSILFFNLFTRKSARDEGKNIFTTLRRYAQVLCMYTCTYAEQYLYFVLLFTEKLSVSLRYTRRNKRFSLNLIYFSAFNGIMWFFIFNLRNIMQSKVRQGKGGIILSFSSLSLLLLTYFAKYLNKNNC